MPAPTPADLYRADLESALDLLAGMARRAPASADDHDLRALAEGRLREFVGSLRPAEAPTDRPEPPPTTETDA